MGRGKLSWYVAGEHRFQGRPFFPHDGRHGNMNRQAQNGQGNGQLVDQNTEGDYLGRAQMKGHDQAGTKDKDGAEYNKYGKELLSGIFSSLFCFHCVNAVFVGIDSLTRFVVAMDRRSSTNIGLCTYKIFQSL